MFFTKSEKNARHIIKRQFSQIFIDQRFLRNRYLAVNTIYTHIPYRILIAKTAEAYSVRMERVKDLPYPDRRIPGNTSRLSCISQTVQMRTAGRDPPIRLQPRHNNCD